MRVSNDFVNLTSYFVILFIIELRKISKLYRRLPFYFDECRKRLLNYSEAPMFRNSLAFICIQGVSKCVFCVSVSILVIFINYSCDHRENKTYKYLLQVYMFPGRHNTYIEETLSFWQTPRSNCKEMQFRRCQDFIANRLPTCIKCYFPRNKNQSQICRGFGSHEKATGCGAFGPPRLQTRSQRRSRLKRDVV